MKNIIKIILSVFLIAACSELKDDITSPNQDISVHQDGINSTSSDQFHGKLVKEAEANLANCQSCHASDYSGSKTEVNCTTCHKTLSVHAGNNSMIYHRDYLKEQNVKMNECQECHATDYSGGVASPSCVECHKSIQVHGGNSSMIYHREFLKDYSGEMKDCQQCHADDFSGGLISPACNTCHNSITVHSAGTTMISHRDYIKTNGGSMDACQQCHGDEYTGGIASPGCTTCHSSLQVHGNGKGTLYHKEYLQSTNWQMQDCQKCHGDDFSGGLTSPTCNTCHSREDGPANCSTCHFDGEISKGDAFHAAHLDAKIGKKVQCVACHTVPQDIYDNGHFDGNAGVELTFGELAITHTNEAGTEGVDPDLPTLIPSGYYDYNQKTCADVYCHGYFKNGNTEIGVNVTSSVGCGSCHGDPATGNPLPRGKHPQITNCVLCHSTVDANKNIVKPEQHINGKLNVYGQERNF